jgi:hypothetical protein
MVACAGLGVRRRLEGGQAMARIRHVLAPVIAGGLLLGGTAAALADPGNAPSAVQFDVSCPSTGQSFTIVANGHGIGSPGHIIGSTGNLIPVSFTLPDGTTFSIGQGNRTGQQEQLVQCTSTALDGSVQGVVLREVPRQ